MKLTTGYLDALANRINPVTKRENIFDTCERGVVRVGPHGLKWYVVDRVRGEREQR